MKKVIIITGNSKRHMHFCAVMANFYEVVKIVREQKFNYQSAYGNATGDSVIDKHFSQRDIVEARYFTRQYDGIEYTDVTAGWMKNNPGIIEDVVHTPADAVLLFGSSIIKPAILDAFPMCVINLHLGLSPYYRGSGTNFWPIVDEKPECVGATIHLASSVVDAGDILHQVRAEDLASSDTIHDIGNKTIRAAFNDMPLVVAGYLEGNISPIKQTKLDDKEYRRSNISNDSIKQAYQCLENGLIDTYLKDRDNRNADYPIINQLQLLR